MEDVKQNENTKFLLRLGFYFDKIFFILAFSVFTLPKLRVLSKGCSFNLVKSSFSKNITKFT